MLDPPEAEPSIRMSGAHSFYQSVSNTWESSPPEGIRFSAARGRAVSTTENRFKVKPPNPPSFFSLFPALKSIHIRSIITLAKTDAKLLLRFNHSSSFYCASITLYTKLQFHQRLAR
nr:hypothetical protein CFP56_61167 [Quercus suber]